jgi:hypothetical protein
MPNHGVDVWRDGAEGHVLVGNDGAEFLSGQGELPVVVRQRFYVVFALVICRACLWGSCRPCFRCTRRARDSRRLAEKGARLRGFPYQTAPGRPAVQHSAARLETLEGWRAFGGGGRVDDPSQGTESMGG